MNTRYCARVLVEARTPLRVGTGETGINIDELVATDCNGLPLLPGTSIAGVLRHQFKDSRTVKDLFGFQENIQGKGSRLIISNANFVGKQGEVIDGLANIDFLDDFYSKFKKMAVRDHAKINHKGVADKEKYGKYDSQVVFKGCRFVFDIELIGSKQDKDIWRTIIKKLSSPLFRIGGGTRKGFGELEIVKLDEKIYDLKSRSQEYLDRSAKLTLPDNGKTEKETSESTLEYELTIEPDDFFLFAAGFGDNEADTIAKKEPVVKWENNTPRFSEEKILIPATSVKGAISHRTAYHYNRLKKKFADKVEKIEDYTGENNIAVKALFGYAKTSDNGKSKGERGNVIFSDLFVEKYSEKIFNYNAIDRFTGGTIDGALFDEKVISTTQKIIFKTVVEKKAFDKTEKEVQEAFECTLKDITTGMLPLGGSVMRGHGCFNGSVKKNGEEI